MASRKDNLDSVAGVGRPSPATRKKASERAQTAGLAEVRVEAERQRQKSARLKRLRLERDAAAPAQAAAPKRKAAQSTLNLAQTQRMKKP
jgi:hypothetical protein